MNTTVSIDKPKIRWSSKHKQWICYALGYWLGMGDTPKQAWNRWFIKNKFVVK